MDKLAAQAPGAEGGCNSVAPAQRSLSSAGYEESQLALRSREVDIAEKELILKQQEAQKSPFSNPLFWGVVATALSVLVNAAVVYYQESNKLAQSAKGTLDLRLQEQNKIDLAKERNKTDLIISAIKADNEDSARRNIQALVDMKLITDAGVIAYLNDKTNRFPVLPSGPLPPAINQLLMRQAPIRLMPGTSLR